jgi:hypothetical protein
MKHSRKSLPTYHVCVTDEATVVDRGERLRVWFVRWNDGWVRAKDHPAAQVDLNGGESSPAGVVWRRTVELELPAGALLRTHVTDPAPHGIGLSPIECLQRGKLGMGRRVKTTTFRVVGNYRLAPLPAEPTPARGAQFQSRGTGAARA